jgi:hypothetical protein
MVALAVVAVIGLVVALFFPAQLGRPELAEEALP